MTKIEQAIDEQKRNRNSRVKKYFSAVKESTQRLDSKPFIEFISDLLAVSLNEASVLIKSYEVTINGDLMIDTEYVLATGDVVRAYTGHFLNNSRYIAVIK